MNNHAANPIPGIKAGFFQVVGEPFPELSGSRLWSFAYAEGYNYISQWPSVEGEIMIGGGHYQSGQKGF